MLVAFGVSIVDTELGVELAFHLAPMACMGPVPDCVASNRLRPLSTFVPLGGLGLLQFVLSRRKLKVDLVSEIPCMRPWCR
jgi:hypothetical protein